MKQLNEINHRLSVLMVEQYGKYPDAFLSCLVNGIAYRRIMIILYEAFTLEGSIQKIEDLAPEEKARIWGRVKHLVVGHCSREQAIEVSKAVYTIEII